MLRIHIARATWFCPIAFLPVCSCRAAIPLSRSSQLRALRDVAFDCLPVGFPVARWRGVSAGDNPDGHGLVHVQRNRDDVLAIELVRYDPAAHGVPIQPHGQVEQRRAVAHADVLAAVERAEQLLACGSSGFKDRGK